VRGALNAEVLNALCLLRAHTFYSYIVFIFVFLVCQPYCFQSKSKCKNEKR